VVVVGYVGYQSMTSGSSPFSEASEPTVPGRYGDISTAEEAREAGYSEDFINTMGLPGELTFPQLCESKGGRVIPGESGCWCKEKGIYINPHFDTCTGEPTVWPSAPPLGPLPEQPKCTMECQRGRAGGDISWQTIKDCPEGAFAIPPAVELRYEWACGGFHIPGQIKPVPFCLSEGDLGQQVTINCAIQNTSR